MSNEENKFTPGPWYPGHLGDDNLSCECAYIVDEGHAGGIAQVFVDNGISSISEGGNDAPSRSEAIANMHLIAAAPSMLYSLDYVFIELETLGGFFEDGDSEGFWETLRCLKTNLKWVREKARNQIKK